MLTHGHGHGHTDTRDIDTDTMHVPSEAVACALVAKRTEAVPRGRPVDDLVISIEVMVPEEGR
jgi:hypothetical protein